MPPQIPPSLEVSLGWRELWRTGGFVQNDLVSQSGFASIVKERLPPLGIRQDWLEEFDEAGAFRPIAFVAGGEPPGVTDLTPYEENMTFGEEQQHAPWSTYEWEAWGHPQITAPYSPWQVLYIDDVLERCNETLPLSALMSSAEDLTTRLKPLKGLIGRLHDSWTALDDAWTPLMKLLVRVQNRYLPEVTRRSTLLRDVGKSRSNLGSKSWSPSTRAQRRPNSESMRTTSFAPIGSWWNEGSTMSPATRSSGFAAHSPDRHTRIGEVPRAAHTTITKPRKCSGCS